MTSRTTAMLLCGASLLCWSTASFAREQPQASSAGAKRLAARTEGAASTQTDSATADIIVTATKRSESALKVPEALTVLRGDDLKTRGVNSLSDLQYLAPNVNIATGRDGVTVAIRGVVTTDTSSKGEQDIAFSVDGAYVGRGNARGAAFFDVDRIEVLRGPQGTLYGRSSTGGAINVITKAPIIGETSGYLKAEIANYNARRAEGAINLPLGDTLALRISGNFNNRDGYSRPIAYSPTFNGTVYSFPASSAKARNDQSDVTGRFSLLFKPSDAATLRLTAAIGHQGGVGSAPALETQLKAANDTGDRALQILANPVPAFLDNDFRNFDGSLNLKFGGAQLDLLGSYQHLDYAQQGTTVQDVGANGGYAISKTFAFGASFGPAFNFFLQRNLVKTTQFEARISNTDSGVFDYVVGANYFNERAGERGQSWNALISNPLAQATYVFQAGPVNVTTHRGYAAFGQGTWHATDQIAVIAGVRYTHNEVKRAGTFALPYNFPAGFPPPSFHDATGAICTYPNDCIGNPNNGGASDNKVTWRVGVNYQVDPVNMFYLAVATGFKGGGFNDYDPTTGAIGQYVAASLTAYEAGYKGRPLPGLTFSSSLFYYAFSKDQVNSFAVFPGGQQGLFTLATPTEIYGWENEASYQVASQTTLNASVTFLHSRFVNFLAGSGAPSGTGISFAGQPKDQSPTFGATLGINHAIDLGDNAKLRLNGSIKYSGSYLLSDFANAVRYRQHSFTRSNASIGYEAADGRYAIQLFVENIENKVQRTSAPAGYRGPYGGDAGAVAAFSQAKPNNISFYTSPPRFYGVRLSTKF